MADAKQDFEDAIDRAISRARNSGVSDYFIFGFMTGQGLGFVESLRPDDPDRADIVADICEKLDIKVASP